YKYTHEALNIMAHKTLTISEEAYEALAGLKKEGESFTDLVKRITAPLRKRKLSEFAGMIKDENFKKAALEARHFKSTRLQRLKL
ncbi:MAG: hypothetical protein MPEBLZ_03346, partial [Candidatus Methanoperedens nitroreducens]